MENTENKELVNLWMQVRNKCLQTADKLIGHIDGLVTVDKAALEAVERLVETAIKIDRLNLDREYQAKFEVRPFVPNWPSQKE